MGFWQKLFASPAKPAPSYSVPDNTRVYAVGDIHGRADLLLKLQALIRADIERHGVGKSIKVIFLGDYIDRGFHSKEVIDTLLKMDMPQVELVFLAGNHEDMLLRFLDDPAEGQLWLGVGGLATLASYGVFLGDDSSVEDLVDASVELAHKLPDAHLAFLKNLPTLDAVGDYRFVHAGVRPGV
ncbi:MAG: serine/threonine protein phosphatase, partial [Kordiimonadaceae bacterium]|nr:serine/threonine protein phosphatase [Kordiimonadaceae bacterium]